MGGNGARESQNGERRRDAYSVAERIRARLPRLLQETREAAGLSKYALAQRSGISREMISRIEQGTANPSVCLTAQLCQGMDLSLVKFLAKVEE